MSIFTIQKKYDMVEICFGVGSFTKIVVWGVYLGKFLTCGGHLHLPSNYTLIREMIVLGLKSIMAFIVV